MIAWLENHTDLQKYKWFRKLAGGTWYCYMSYIQMGPLWTRQKDAGLLLCVLVIEVYK